jgi:ABC-type polysaccharide/polyol phosphate export permease
MAAQYGAALARTWGYRWLLLNFFQREIKTRYIGSVTGLFWALIHPVALLAVYAMVFTTIFRVKFPELEGHGFIAFVAVALWPWMAFQESIQRGMAAIQNGAGLIKKVAFPHELLVYGAVAATYAVQLSGMTLAILILAAFETLEIHISAIPVALLMLLIIFLASAGIALLFAALQTLLKDVEHILVPVFMVWFYVTPILYPASLVPPAVRQMILLNPLSFLLERLRDSLLFGRSELSLYDFLALLVGISIFAFGRWFFNRLSPHFEDFL